MSKRLLTLGLVVILSISFSIVPRGNAADPQTALPQSVFLNVPFTSQAPFGEWNDPRQRDGCEETSIKMAMMWVHGAAAPAEEVRRDIINMSEYEKVMYGTFVDTSAADTAKLMQTFYSYPKVNVINNISTTDIKIQIAAGNLVIVPINTRLLKHAYYRTGPTRHTLVVTGYDNQAGMIIVHDPLHRDAINFRIPEAEFNNALSDYYTGNHLAIGAKRTAMIVVSK